MEITLEDEVPKEDPYETLVNNPAQPSTQPNPQASEKLCLVCGFPIEYQPGHRRGKYHPECRPTQSVGTGTAGRRTNIDTLIEQIADLYRNVGIGLAFVPTMSLDGMVVAGESGKLAESWRPLIEKDPKIRKVWERITTGSGWGTVVMAHAGIGLAIASNHGVNLPGLTQPPVEAPTDHGGNGL